MLSAHICAQRTGRVCYGLGCSLFKTWSTAAACFRTLELSWTSREERPVMDIQARLASWSSEVCANISHRLSLPQSQEHYHPKP